MELPIILVLLSFGARRVSQLGRSLGSGIRQFRKEVAAGTARDKGELERRDHRDGEVSPPNIGAAARGRMSRAWPGTWAAPAGGARLEGGSGSEGEEPRGPRPCS